MAAISSAAFANAFKTFGGNASQFMGSGGGQQFLGAAELVSALGTKIGAAAQQAKANKLALQAANQNAASARESLADAGNPMANPAVQAAVSATEKKIAEQARQQEQLASIAGATPEQKMAQYQMAQQALADVYGNIASNAGENYNAVKNNAAQADIAVNNLNAQQYANKAAQLNAASGNLFKSGQKAFMGGTK